MSLGLNKEEMNIPLWAKICEISPGSLSTQITVKFSETIELIDGILSGNYQEIMDGITDVDWMVKLVESVSNDSDLFDSKITLEKELDKLVSKINKSYPGLVEEYFDDFKEAVLVSNFSKFCYSEVDKKLTQEKYNSIGVDVYFSSQKVGDTEVYVVKSSKVQEDVNGNFYPKDKILKGNNYHSPKIKVDYILPISPHDMDFLDLERKISPLEIKDLIVKCEFDIVEGTTSTICTMHLKNGHVVVGQSACIAPSDFDSGKGKEVAYQNAFDKIWELEGYHRRSLIKGVYPKGNG